METFKNHITENLDSFLEFKNQTFFDNIFEYIFEKLNFQDKEKYRKLLQYLYCITEKSRNQENELSVLNIHFQKVINDREKTLIVEFLWHYFFESQRLKETSNEKNLILEKRINTLKENTNKALLLPSIGPMATTYEKRQVNAKKNELLETRKVKKKHLSFYKSLNKNASLQPAALINLKVNQERDLSTYFNSNPTYLNTEELSDLNSFTLYNTKEFNEIKMSRINNTPLLQLIENIVLFDCENSLQRFSSFNFQLLSNLNNHHGTKFDLFLVVTFSNKENFVFIKNKIKRLKERYYIPNDVSYIITSHEFDYLTQQEQVQTPEINFLGPSSSVFWEDFYLETKINGLYELRSIRMMNIYSLCFNQEIKEYVLANIFSDGLIHSLITEETKQDIFNLPNEDILKLKELLSNVLDIVIKTDLKPTIINGLIRDYKIVLDDFILENEHFFDLVKKSINARSNGKFISWDSLEENSDITILVLSYRDQGNFNNNFYPNINEIVVSENTKIKGLFQALFFKKINEWSKYNLISDYFKTLDHPIRRHNFNWDKLSGRIKKFKPEKSVDVSWDLEIDYTGSDTRITYKIVFESNKHSTCNPSDLHIYYEDDNKQKRIQPIRWIYENLELEDNKLFIQKLDELIEEFNPAERLIDTKQQESDLDVIRKQFDLGEESAGRLWKILLARKAANSSVEILYNILKDLFTKNSLEIVSQSYFESTWVNPESASLVPRGNKAFKLICKYLGLPTTYSRIIYTIKNRNINGRRNATRIYSKLLKNLFNDGFFDEGANTEQILKAQIDYYKSNHNLDELGIDEENPLKGISTLVELIRPELSFKEVNSIEKREE
tara:strand:- start:1226 stop:3745 length:2520 start_codon:yes stop_codon:yes gene_type:complete